MRGSSIGRIPEDKEYPAVMKVWTNDAISNKMMLTCTVTVEKTHISLTYNENAGRRQTWIRVLFQCEFSNSLAVY
jgi:hypothetical protein